MSEPSPRDDRNFVDTIRALISSGAPGTVADKTNTDDDGEPDGPIDPRTGTETEFEWSSAGTRGGYDAEFGAEEHAEATEAEDAGDPVGEDNIVPIRAAAIEPGAPVNDGDAPGAEAAEPPVVEGNGAVDGDTAVEHFGLDGDVDDADAGEGPDVSPEEVVEDSLGDANLTGPQEEAREPVILSAPDTPEPGDEAEAADAEQVDVNPDPAPAVVLSASKPLLLAPADRIPDMPLETKSAAGGTHSGDEDGALRSRVADIIRQELGAHIDQRIETRLKALFGDDLSRIAAARDDG